MPLFPIIDTESLVQEGDKTRLDASKSFAAGVGPITAMTIQPGKNAGAIDVLNASYLDWLFDFTLEIDAQNNSIDFQEDGQALANAVIAPGTYTPAALAAVVEAALDSAGDLDYTVTCDAQNALTISATGKFSLLPVTGAHLDVSALSQIGFSQLLPAQSVLVSSVKGSDWTGKNAYTGYPIEQVQRLITISISNDDPLTATKVVSLQVVSKLADKLFSNDDMLRKHESDILKYVADGRATFLDIHRRAQTLIMAWLDTQGFIDDLGYKFTLKACLSLEEFAEWSTHMVLRLIFEGLVVSTDDIFSKKADRYESREAFYRNRSVIRMDMDQDGEIDISETLDSGSAIVVRR